MGGVVHRLEIASIEMREIEVVVIARTHDEQSRWVFVGFVDVHQPVRRLVERATSGKGIDRLGLRLK